MRRGSATLWVGLVACLLLAAGTTAPAAIAGAPGPPLQVAVALTNSTGSSLSLDTQKTADVAGYFSSSSGQQQAPPATIAAGATVTVWSSSLPGLAPAVKGTLAYTGDGGGVQISYLFLPGASTVANCTSYGADPQSYFCANFKTSGPSSGGVFSVSLAVTPSPCPGATQSACPYGQVVPFGSLGSGPGQFAFPWGVAVNSGTGVLGVASESSSAVDTFSSTGLPPAFKAAFAMPSGPQVPQPVGVAADPKSGNLVVTDTANNWVAVFSSNGTVLGKYNSGGIGPAVLNSPNGIAVDPNTQFQYVANTGNNNVQMYSPRGNFIQFWGQAGGGTYDFRLPYGVAVNPVTDHVYVADSGNNRVQVFSYLGFYVSTISVPTSASYAFSAPRNLAFDPSGNLYVGDITGHVFQFNSSGTYVAEWGGNGLSTAGGFQFGVGGMAVTPTGTLFAADPANNRVQGFASIQQQALMANSSSSVAGGWAAPRVHCRRGTGACRGFVRLFHRGAWAGTHSFALPAGQTRTVRVHLNRRARAALGAALARGRKATALAVVQTRQSTGRLVRTQGRVFRLRASG